MTGKLLLKALSFTRMYDTHITHIRQPWSSVSVPSVSQTPLWLGHTTSSSCQLPLDYCIRNTETPLLVPCGSVPHLHMLQAHTYRLHLKTTHLLLIINFHALLYKVFCLPCSTDIPLSLKSPPHSIHPAQVQSTPPPISSNSEFITCFAKRSSSSHHTLTFFINPSLNKSPTPLPPINPETLPNTLSPYLSSLFHSTLTHPFNTSQTFSLSSLLFNLYYNYAH